MTLEQAIAYIDDDELVEVTPKSIRLRKRHLDPHERKRASQGQSRGLVLERPSIRERLRQQSGAYVQESAQLGQQVYEVAHARRSGPRDFFPTRTD